MLTDASRLGRFTVLVPTGEGPFVCPFCGWLEATRDDLENHFTVASPRCGKNRNTNNPTQSKYGDADDE